jgi:hypothetical protein
VRSSNVVSHIFTVTAGSLACQVTMGGATRDGCKHLSSADNETLRRCFEATDPTDNGAPRDICVHCQQYMVATTNITKKVQHIALCKAFKSKCDGEETDSQFFRCFRHRVVLACEQYRNNTNALAKESEWKPCLLA